MNISKGKFLSSASFFLMREVTRKFIFGFNKLILGSYDNYFNWNWEMKMQFFLIGFELFIQNMEIL